jgi:Cdc6-like AAA superfamily ATPase
LIFGNTINSAALSELATRAQRSKTVAIVERGGAIGIRDMHRLVSAAAPHSAAALLADLHLRAKIVVVALMNRSSQHDSASLSLQQVLEVCGALCRRHKHNAMSREELVDVLGRLVDSGAVERKAARKRARAGEPAAYGYSLKLAPADVRRALSSDIVVAPFLLSQ